MTPKSNYIGSRNLSLDLIKIVAMCMVVCLHTTYQFVIPGKLNLSFILYNLGVISIPLFFMVSGYLLIGRNNATYTYSLKKIIKIFRFVAIIIGCFWLMYSLLKGFSISWFVRNYVGSFIQRGTFSVYWYFGTMIILYCLYPLINKVYLECQKFYILLLTSIGLIQNTVFIWNIIGNGEQIIIQTFRIWNWLFYFLLGGMIKKTHYHYSSSLLLSILPLLILCVLAEMNWIYPYLNSNKCEFFYSSPLVVALCLNIFYYLKSLKIKQSAVITTLSSLFLPVYTLHIFIINSTYNYCVALQSFPCCGVAIYWFSILLITITLSWLLLKIPYIKNIFKL